MRKNKKYSKNCVQCNIEFMYEIPDCCSFVCGNRLKSKNNRFWEVATEEQKLERLKQAFNRYVIKHEDLNKCWGWSATKTETGYGHVSYNQTMIKTNRASWMIHCGPIPKGIHVLHKCDARDCSNPSHLFLGTHIDNMKDMVNKGRHRGNKKRETV